MKCQLGVMEEPKENADKVSWTAYGASHRPLRWENRNYAPVAQLAEQLICNQQVGGSIPSWCSSLCRCRIMVIPQLAKLTSRVRFPPSAPFLKTVSANYVIFDKRLIGD